MPRTTLNVRDGEAQLVDLLFENIDLNIVVQEALGRGLTPHKST